MRERAAWAFVIVVRNMPEEDHHRQQDAHENVQQPDAERAAGHLQRTGMVLQPVDNTDFERLGVGHEVGDDLPAVAAEP